MLILSFHDLYHADPENGWEKIDDARFLEELNKGLKPGGTVGIIDHCAESGAPSESGGTLHRIDPAIVIAKMEKAGFELVARSDILRNANDDTSKIVFTPELRGKTDRFILQFRKPGMRTST
jgi:predicted methyltransferase